MPSLRSLPRVPISAPRIQDVAVAPKESQGVAVTVRDAEVALVHRCEAPGAELDEAVAEAGSQGTSSERQEVQPLKQLATGRSR